MALKISTKKEMRDIGGTGLLPIQEYNRCATYSDLDFFGCELKSGSPLGLENKLIPLDYVVKKGGTTPGGKDLLTVWNKIPNRVIRVFVSSQSLVVNEDNAYNTYGRDINYNVAEDWGEGSACYSNKTLTVGEQYWIYAKIKSGGTYPITTPYTNFIFKDEVVIEVK